MAVLNWDGGGFDACVESQISVSSGKESTIETKNGYMAQAQAQAQA
jgi:hypothetical protein